MSLLRPIAKVRMKFVMRFGLHGAMYWRRPLWRPWPVFADKILGPQAMAQHAGWGPGSHPIKPLWPSIRGGPGIRPLPVVLADENLGPAAWSSALSGPLWYQEKRPWPGI